MPEMSAHHTCDGNSQNARGYWNNQLNPVYIAALGPVNGNHSAGKAHSGLRCCTAPATSANVAILDADWPAHRIPPPSIAAANAAPANSALASARCSTAFPTVQHPAGYLGGPFSSNFSYNAAAVHRSQRDANGLSFNVNYPTPRTSATTAPSAADSTFRPRQSTAAAKTGTRIGSNGRGAGLAPQVLHAFGVYQLPFGTAGHLGGKSLITRELVGGWQLSGIYTYASPGSPVVVTWGQSGNCSGAAPNAGQCQASINPAFTGGSARVNGSYGSGAHGFTTCNIGVGTGCTAKQLRHSHCVPAQPADISTISGTHQYLIGKCTSQCTAEPQESQSTENLNASIQRSFPIYGDRAVFIFQADCTNVWNKVTFGGPNGSWGQTSAAGVTPIVYAATFGQVTSASGNPRDWQFSGNINFEDSKLAAQWCIWIVDPNAPGPFHCCTIRGYAA